jgi:hypothetical protein
VGAGALIKRELTRIGPKASPINDTDIFTNPEIACGSGA